MTATSNPNSFCCRLFHFPQIGVLCLSVLAADLACLFYSSQTGFLCFSALVRTCCSVCYNGCLFQLGLFDDRFAAIFCTVGLSKPLSQDFSPFHPWSLEREKKSFNMTVIRLHKKFKTINQEGEQTQGRLPRSCSVEPPVSFSKPRQRRRRERLKQKD